jgi:hypothetical protein
MSKINCMESYLHENNLAKISQFDNAVFYCINSSSQRVPVGVVKNIHLLADKKIEFEVSHFPVLENNWNVFAAELHLYKKGLSFNMTLHGTSWFINQNELKVQFKVLYEECFGQPETKISLQNSLAEFFNTTGMFFKKMLITGF